MPLVNENIKILRKRMGMTQEKFAEVLGIKRSLIGAYEENRAIPPADNLNRISKVFGITLDQLINYSYEKEFNRHRDNNSVLHTSEQYPIERKSVFQNTQRELPTVQPSLFEPVKSQETRGKGIKYIKASLFDKYISGNDFSQYSENLPSLQLPFFTQDNLWAFDAPQDFLMENCVLIVEKILNFEDIVEGENHLLVSTSSGFKYRRVYNQIRLKGVLLTNSDKSGVSSEEFKVSDIKEIWKPISFISKSMPLPEISLESVQSKVDSLKAEIDFMLNFRATK
ncbi:XRE family transcriptional regulator [Lacihabitans sp. LS3-19]|uniref:helix-turn-helix domain-containing protein n=1 Tax=Lacihabitans sp. LS3-19 TaxID=2487335 RepID=UPI0020CDE79A|nr:helix-turn-helix transcriptional regulator [Lacihabitans sp. LS3-19]MCP9768710.1 XRE family transcriptional regulator [Lacihabitans sp. LS3-19]